MGSVFSRVHKLFDQKRNYKILILGLDNAGKTTLVTKWKLKKEPFSVVPTVGMNLESLEYKNLSFTVYDISGQQSIRKMWRVYHANTDAVMFLIDSTDTSRFNEVRYEIDRLMNDDGLKHTKFLFLFNKQDLSNALSCSELVSELDLANLARDRHWGFQPMVAYQGDEYIQGLEWIAKALKK